MEPFTSYSFHLLGVEAREVCLKGVRDDELREPKVVGGWGCVCDKNVMKSEKRCRNRLPSVYNGTIVYCKVQVCIALLNWVHVSFANSCHKLIHVDESQMFRACADKNLVYVNLC